MNRSGRIINVSCDVWHFPVVPEPVAKTNRPEGIVIRENRGSPGTLCRECGHCVRTSIDNLDVDEYRPTLRQGEVDREDGVAVGPTGSRCGAFERIPAGHTLRREMCIHRDAATAESPAEFVDQDTERAPVIDERTDRVTRPRRERQQAELPPPVPAGTTNA